MNTDNVYKRNTTFRVRIINRENILFNSKDCYKLNELALIIWKNINGKNSVNDIINIVSEEYSVDRVIIIEDVVDFIEQLLEANAIIDGVCK